MKDLPNIPDIFLTIISDFVEAVIDDRQDYSPSVYTPILFPKGDHYIPWSAIDWPSARKRGFPLGAIDPLNLVANLVQTLTLLWENRSITALNEFSSFRFGGLGLLQARRNDDVEWTTILAYCGGTEYVKTEDGGIFLSEAGHPTPKGKCGHTPLVLGNHQTCSSCQKLLCDRCGFCSVVCRDRAFQALAHDRNNVDRRQKDELANDGKPTIQGPPWEEVPWGTYDDYFR